jgi:hypothetical protein
MIAAEIESRLSSSARELVNVANVAIVPDATTIDVSKILLKTMENMMSRFALKCVEECAKRYGFNLEEAVAMLGLNVSIQEKVMQRKPKGERVVKAKKDVSEAKVKVRGERFALPFIPGLVKEELCQGLVLNGGLFTQCLKAKKEGCEYCEKCEEKADENGMTVARRIRYGLMEFKNLKNQKVVSYSTYLTKKNVSRAEAEEKARELGVVIPEEYWEVQERKRGRPKKEKKEVEVSEDNEEEEEEEKREEKPKKGRKVMSDEEKAAKKAERDAAKREKLAEKETERKNQLEEMKVQDIPEPIVTPTQEADPIVTPTQEAEPVKITVKKLMINGKKYLKTPANVLYDAETKEEVGTYDPINKTIIPLPVEEDSEVEEEEYSDSDM